MWQEIAATLAVGFAGALFGAGASWAAWREKIRHFGDLLDRVESHHAAELQRHDAWLRSHQRQIGKMQSEILVLKARQQMPLPATPLTDPD